MQVQENKMTIGVDSDNFIDELFEALDEQEAKELKIENPNAEGFGIRTEEQANYWIRKVKEIQAEKAQIAEKAQGAIDSYTNKVQNFLDKSYGPLNRQEEFLVNALQSYAEGERQKNPGKKTFRLIEGTLSFKKQQPAFEYDDEALLSYLKEDEILKKEYVNEKIDYKPDKTKLKKDGKIIGDSLMIGGKSLVGITVTPRPDKFDIK